MNDVVILIFQLIALLFSVIIHEISHGVMALKLGDDTAKRAGRLTMNPIKHLDPIGSFLVPFSLFFLTGGGFVIGWAKPVPYNPFRLKDPKKGAGLIAAAGPISNIALAIIFGIILRGLALIQGVAMVATIILLLRIVILINIALAIFNLLPFPPLDGSSVLFSLLPRGYEHVQHFLMRYGFVLLLAFIFFGFSIIEPIIFGLYRLIAGGG